MWKSTATPISKAVETFPVSFVCRGKGKDNFGYKKKRILQNTKNICISRQRVLYLCCNC
jgi:hypothetical protein